MRALAICVVIALVGLALSKPSGRTGGKKVVCYFGSWAVYRPSPGKFDVESIDPFLCTHLIFGFVGLRNGVITSLDPWNDKCEDYGKGQFKRFTYLKTLNPDLKTSVAIGGWNEGSEKYSQMASTAAGRRRFIDSVIPFLQEFGFDGLDLDWEYPAHRGGVPEDKKNFALLASELRQEFNKHGYLLTAAVSAGAPTIKDAYDVPSVSRDLDFINIMAYDFHGAWDKHTGHHAPLFTNPKDTGDFAVFNANSSVHYWMSLGAPKEKLILGMGTYGRGVTLNNPSENGLYAPGNEPLRAGPYTREKGFWGYNEICETMSSQSGQWTVVTDPYYQAPYAYREREWIGYDDPTSIKKKAEYARDMGLGGGMIWSLETDDFNGKCHGEGFPLIRTIYRTLIGEYTSSPKPTDPPRAWSSTVCPKPTWWPPAATNAPAPVEEVDNSITEGTHHTTSRPETVTEGTSDPEPPASEVCKTSGLNKDPKGDCRKFYNCVPDGNKWRVYPQSCAPGTAFDPNAQSCAYPSAVPGCAGKVRSVSHYKNYFA